MKGLKYIAIIIIIIFIISNIAFSSSNVVAKPNFIRLHIIANSDSPEDQALKNRVRDRLLLAFGEGFQETPTLEQARALINSQLTVFEDIALQEIIYSGYSYAVKAELGVFSFPTKAYGDTVYPAGRYEALRVVIGDGSGANWWCVMFPPLCFVDVSTGVARRSADAESGEQVQKINDSKDNSNVKVEYTFKAVEWWKNIKPKLKKFFSI